MRRSTSASGYLWSKRPNCRPKYLAAVPFRYFEHLITVLTVAAILAFLLNYRFSFYANSHHSGSGSHYRFARQFNALVSSV